MFFYFGTGSALFTYVNCSQRDALLVLFIVDVSFLIVCDTLKWSVVWFLCCTEGSPEPVMERKGLTDVADEVMREEAAYEESTGHPSYPLRSRVPRASDQDAGLNLIEGDRHSYLDKRPEVYHNKSQESPHSVVHKGKNPKAPVVGHFEENVEDVLDEKDRQEEAKESPILDVDRDLSDDKKQELQREDEQREKDDPIIDTVENHDPEKSKKYVDSSGSDRD